MSLFNGRTIQWLLQFKRLNSWAGTMKVNPSQKKKRGGMTNTLLNESSPHGDDHYSYCALQTVGVNIQAKKNDLLV